MKEIGRCFCGKEEKEVGCGEGAEVECLVFRGDGEEGVEKWVGRYECEGVCDRYVSYYFASCCIYVHHHSFSR